MNCVSLVSDKGNGNTATAAVQGLRRRRPRSPATAAGLREGLLPQAPSPPLPGDLGPPPPPGLPQTHLNGYSQFGKKRMRSFYWKTIPEEQVRGKTNIWTLAASQQHRYQIGTPRPWRSCLGSRKMPPWLPLPGGRLLHSPREAREEVRVAPRRGAAPRAARFCVWVFASIPRPARGTEK